MQNEHKKGKIKMYDEQHPIIIKTRNKLIIRKKNISHLTLTVAKLNLEGDRQHILEIYDRRGGVPRKINSPDIRPEHEIIADYERMRTLSAVRDYLKKRGQ